MKRSTRGIVAGAFVSLSLFVATTGPAEAFFRPRAGQQPQTARQGSRVVTSPNGSWGFHANNAAAAVTVDPATVEKYFEDFAAVFTSGLDATNGRRGATLLCGAVSYTYGALGRMGASTFTADLALNGCTGIGSMAVLYGDGAVSNGSGSASGTIGGQAATFQMMSGAALPASADEATALWDTIFGEASRGGYGLQAIDGGFCLKASGADRSAVSGTASARSSWKILFLVVPDPEDATKALVVLHAGWGAAAAAVY